MEPIQAKSLEMAEYFVAFCREHQLLCYLCGGGAIGALRHGGFIPWDDDLDFFMPREDYDKLTDLWPRYADTRYVLSRSNEHYLDRNNFLTIRDSETTCVKPYQADLDIVHGLPLDVLPLDYAPKRPLARKIQKLWAYIYSLYCAQTIPAKHGGLMAWGSRILLALVPTQKGRYRIWKTAERHMTKYRRDEAAYRVELCSGPTYMRKQYPIALFDAAVMFPFEATEMPLPVGYDAYLTEAFGDYMTPPPVQQQVAHHDILRLDLERSYREYHGDYTKE